MCARKWSAKREIVLCGFLKALSALPAPWLPTISRRYQFADSCVRFETTPHTTSDIATQEGRPKVRRLQQTLPNRRMHQFPIGL